MEREEQAGLGRWLCEWRACRANPRSYTGSQHCVRARPQSSACNPCPGEWRLGSLTEIVNSEFSENLPQKNKVEGLRRLSADLSEHPIYMNAYAGGTGKEAGGH